nr:DUF1294 domain-containing protein [Phosphitispora fastidiosa]
MIIVNICGFITMAYDKFRAKSGGRRIPEINFFITSVLGGAAGVFLGMRIFRHKTKHYSFVIGIPILFGLNILSAYLFFQVFS